jgi:2-polyprenyl-6-methoxyphenol hydroxylase-like FAD-dependent oxidoreductase
MTTFQRPRTGDVVIVGAGPVGLVAACELACRGVTVRIIDKLAVPAAESRAIVVHGRSLEMFGRMGLAGEIIDSGVKSLAMQMYAAGRRLARADFDRVDSAYPFSVTTAQTDTERILTEALQALGVTIDRGTELTGLTQDTGAAHLILRRSDGTQEQVDCGRVVGADGGHSTVRDLVGTRLQGSFQGERFLLGDVEAEHHLDLDSMYTYFAPGGPLLVFPMRGRRMRFIAKVHPDPAVAPATSPTQDQLQQIVDERAGGIQIIRSRKLTGFDIHHAQVPAFRFGRVFLAGDAAHIHSPAGGQGMNTGMQDAFNLAWKLALAIQGRDGQRLLDSYHAERHPVAANVIEFTTRLTQVGTLSGEVAIKLRNEVVHAASGLAPIRHAIADQTEEIALAYRHSPIVIGNHRHHSRVAAGDHAPHIADETIAQQLRAAWATDATGHLVLTIAARKDAPEAAAIGSAVQVLITDGIRSRLRGRHRRSRADHRPVLRAQRRRPRRDPARRLHRTDRRGCRGRRRLLRATHQMTACPAFLSARRRTEASSTSKEKHREPYAATAGHCNRPAGHVPFQRPADHRPGVSQPVGSRAHHEPRRGPACPVARWRASAR